MLLLIYIFISGLCIGSFLNVLIDRLSNDQSIMGRSHCDHCRRTLKFADLVPVFSYFLSGGRCRYCSKKISLWYPFVEAATGVIFVLTWIYLPSPSVASLIPAFSWQIIMIKILYLAMMSMLIVTFVADIKYRIIPDQTTAALVIFSIPVAYYEFINSANPLQSHLTAGLVLMLTLYFLHIVTRGRGMGLGDVKFAFAMGMMLGLRAGFLALYGAFIIGGLFSVFLILFRLKGLKSKIAFGPFLVLSTVIMLFWQEDIMRLVARYFNLM